MSSSSFAFGIAPPCRCSPRHLALNMIMVGTEMVGRTSLMSVSMSARMNQAAEPGLAASRSCITCHCSNSGSSARVGKYLRSSLRWYSRSPQRSRVSRTRRCHSSTGAPAGKSGASTTRGQVFCRMSATTRSG